MNSMTKRKAAEMLYTLNCYTNRNLSESFLWESDIENPKFSNNIIQRDWLSFLAFVQKRYPSVFDELLNGAYITTVFPQRGFDTSAFAYFNALIGRAHWAPQGQQPKTDLPCLNQTERDQYEIIACYIASYASISEELRLFYESLNESSGNELEDFANDLRAKNAFDIFWAQPVSFDTASNSGCRIR